MIDYSADVKNLPPELRTEALGYLEHGDHGSIAVLLTDHHKSGGARSLETLVVLACAVFMDAYEVMVDRVVPACQDALALLSEAERLVPSSPRLSVYRRDIQGVLPDSIAREASAEASDSVAIDAGEVSAEQMANAAYRSWKRHEHRKAADLFLGAARLEVAEAATRNKWAAPDASMNYIVRAGQCLFEAGEHHIALPLLEQATAFDWRKGRLWGDRHTTQWAYGAMLESSAVSEDWVAFEATWAAAISRCQELKMTFPSIHSIQERLLQLCLDARQDSYLPHLVTMIELRDKRLPDEVVKRIQEAKNRVNN